MPRYYLHSCNGIGFVEDEEGVELADAAAARAKAIEGLRDVMAGELKDGAINMASFIEIEDDRRQLVETVEFSDAVEVRTERSRRRPR